MLQGGCFIDERDARKSSRKLAARTRQGRRRIGQAGIRHELDQPLPILLRREIWNSTFCYGWWRYFVGRDWKKAHLEGFEGSHGHQLRTFFESGERAFTT